LRLCGAREEEAGRVAGSSSILHPCQWATTREDIKDSHIFLLIFQPVFPSPEDMLGNTSIAVPECPGGKL
jgi:hypothetical protein